MAKYQRRAQKRHARIATYRTRKLATWSAGCERRQLPGGLVNAIVYLRALVLVGGSGSRRGEPWPWRLRVTACRASQRASWCWCVLPRQTPLYSTIGCQTTFRMLLYKATHPVRAERPLGVPSACAGSVGATTRVCLLRHAPTHVRRSCCFQCRRPVLLARLSISVRGSSRWGAVQRVPVPSNVGLTRHFCLLHRGGWWLAQGTCIIGTTNTAPTASPKRVQTSLCATQAIRRAPASTWQAVCCVCRRVGPLIGTLWLQPRERLRRRR